MSEILCTVRAQLTVADNWPRSTLTRVWTGLTREQARLLTREIDNGITGKLYNETYLSYTVEDAR